MGRIAPVPDAGNAAERVAVLEEAGQLALAHVCAAAHGLVEDAQRIKELAEAQGITLSDLKEGHGKGQLLQPPTPITRCDNWPLLTIPKSSLYDMYDGGNGVASAGALPRRRNRGIWFGRAKGGRDSPSEGAISRESVLSLSLSLSREVWLQRHTCLLRWNDTIPFPESRSLELSDSSQRNLANGTRFGKAGVDEGEQGEDQEDQGGADWGGDDLDLDGDEGGGLEDEDDEGGGWVPHAASQRLSSRSRREAFESG